VRWERGRRAAAREAARRAVAGFERTGLAEDAANVKRWLAGPAR
jgi:hypothetical protein